MKAGSGVYRRETLAGCGRWIMTEALRNSDKPTKVR